MRVLFLDLDTLRPDHLGCYGYSRDTSPNIDRIAGQGVRFNRYYTSDAPCLPARAALVTGMFGIHNGAIGHGGTCADMRLEGETRGFSSEMSSHALWRLFRNSGLQTCTISPFADRHTSYWFLTGFNEMHDYAGKCGNESAEEITPTVMKWLDDHAGQDNWLLHVNYWDPHTNYRAPAEFGNPFESDPIPEWLTEDVLEYHKTLAGCRTARDNSMYKGDAKPQFPRHVGDINSMQALKRCIDGYDCGIRYMDEHIGMILKKLEEQGVLEETVIIVTSDHGENFGELGIYSEHATADESTCHIPMIIKWPGMKQGHVDEGLHYNIDLAPTVAELLKVKPWDKWDGRSYAAALTGGAETGRDELVLSQACHVCQRSVRWGQWLYMRTYHDGFHPHFDDAMLFDIESDPHETVNLASTRPDVVQEGERRLGGWHDRMMGTMPFGYTTDPMDTVLAQGPAHAQLGEFPAYAKRLRETGRGQWLDVIKRRHPQVEL